VDLAATGVVKSENRKEIKKGLDNVINLMSDWLFSGR